MAGPPVRMFAWGLDVLIRTVAYSILSIPLSLLGLSGTGILLVLVFLGEWLYPVFFELRWQGATPGKRSLGLQVIHDDGTPVGGAASVIRNLIRFADFLPLAYGFGLASMLLSRDFKRLGDLAAGTVVVRRHAEEPPGELAEASPRPPPLELSREEQQALVDYAERQSHWSLERSLELADLLRPLVGAYREETRQRVLGVANWLIGRRQRGDRRPEA